MPFTKSAPRLVATAAASLVLALVAAGCGGTVASPRASLAPAPATSAAPSSAASVAPSSSPAASQPSTGRIVVADSGFAITLPDGWESIPVDPAQFQAFVESLPADSELRGVLESQAGAVQQAIKFWAFDVRPEDTANGFARNLNIIAQPATTMSLSAIESAAKASLASIAAIHQPITSAIVDLPAGPALRLDYTLDVPAADGVVIGVAGTQYYIQLPNATLIVSFSTDQASLAAASKDFDAIVNSIENVS